MSCSLILFSSSCSLSYDTSCIALLNKYYSPKYVLGSSPEKFNHFKYLENDASFIQIFIRYIVF